MKIEGKNYQTIWFEKNEVKIIDQTKLPHKFVIKNLRTVKDAINAIKNMEVRGAPLIGATAAYGLVLSIIEKNDLSFLKKSSDSLISSRPTAINLKWAVDRMMKKLSGVNDRDILKKALAEAKSIIDEAVDGVDAVAKIKAAAYNLVICDIKMPKKDGIEVLNFIKKFSEETNVIMISGHGDLKTAVQAMRIGAFDYIEKPPDLNNLLTSVRGALKSITPTKTTKSKKAIKKGR